MSISLGEAMAEAVAKMARGETCLPYRKRATRDMVREYVEMGWTLTGYDEHGHANLVWLHDEVPA
jgi:hypothetical protein